MKLNLSTQMVIFPLGNRTKSHRSETFPHAQFFSQYTARKVNGGTPSEWQMELLLTISTTPKKRANQIPTGTMTM